MATISTYALMANAVYDPSPEVPGWRRVAFQPAVDSAWEGDAFQGAAFKRGNEVVFAFKGTALVRDAITDIKLGIGMNTGQFNQAGRFVRDAQVNDGSVVTVCGHSLGGAIAQIVGNRQRLPFVTFNAPGVGLFSRNLDEMAVTAVVGTGALRFAMSAVSALRHPGQALEDLGSILYQVRGVNFRLGHDVVGSIGVHYGDVVQIPYTGGAMDVMAKHKMGSMIEALSGSAYETVQLLDLV